MFNVVLSALAASAAACMTHKYTEKKYKNNNGFRYKFADLLENEIINSSKIQEQFDKAELDDNFNEISEEFFENYFMDDIRNLKLGDISVFKDSYYGLKETIQDLLIREMDKKSGNTIFDVKANLIFDEEQTHIISTNIAKNLSVFFQKTSVLESCCDKILNCIGDMKLSEVVTSDFMKSIEKNLDAYSIKFIDLIKNNYDEKIDEILIRSLDGAELNDIIFKVIEGIGEEKLYIALGMDRRKFIDQLTKDIKSYFRTDYGKSIINTAADDIFANIKYKKTSLHDIIDKTFEKKLQEKVEKYRDESEKVLEKWIDDIHGDVENSINTSVRKYVSDENLAKKIAASMLAVYDKNNKSNGKGEIYSILKDCYEEFNKDKKNDTVDNYIANEIYKKSSSVHISDYLGKTLNIDSSDDIYKYFIDNLENEGNSILKKLLKVFLNTEVSELIKFDVNKFMKVKYKYILVDYIKDQLFYNKQIYKVITGKMSKLVFSLKDEKIRDIIDDDVLKLFTANLKFDLRDKLNNDGKCSITFQRIIDKYMCEHTLGDFVHMFSNEEGEEFRKDDLESLTNFMFSSKYDQVAEIRVDDIIKKIADSKEISHNVSGGFKCIVTKSLRSISKGFTYVKVINHLRSLPKLQYDDYYGKVSAYSNKRLLAISIFTGGILGASLSYIPSMAEIPMFISSIGGGILIDVFCINGFYRRKSKTATISVRRKFDFQNRIKFLIEGASEAISDDKDKEIITRSDEQVNAIKYDIKTSLTEKDAKIIGASISNNADVISDVFASEFCKFLSDEKNVIVSKYYSDISKMSVKKIFNTRNLKKLNEKIDKNGKSNVDNYLDFAFEMLSKNEFGKVCSGNFRKRILEVFDYEISKQYSDIFSSMNSPKDLGKYFDNKININFDDKSLREIFSQNAIDNVETSIFDKLYHEYFSELMLNDLAYNNSVKLNKFYFDGKRLEDLLSIRAKIMITSMFYKRFNDSVCSAHGYIKKYHDNKTDDVLSNLYKRLSNREDEKFKVIGREVVINNILDDFYENETEKICRDNLERLYESSKTFTVEILNLFARDLGLYVDKNEYKGVINELVYGSKARNMEASNLKPLVYLKAEGVFDNFCKYITDGKYKDYKKYMFDFKISNFMDYQQKYFSKGLGKVIEYYIDNKEKLLAENHKTMKEIYDTVLNSIKLFDMCKCKSDVKKDLYEKILEADENTDFINLAFISFYDGIYNYLENMDIVNSFVDSKKLKFNLEEAMATVYNKDIFSNILSQSIKNNFSDGIGAIELSKFDDNTKRYMLDMIVDEIFVDIDNHLNSLYEKLNIKEIIETGLSEMDSKRAEKLFEYHDLKFKGMAK